MPMDQTIKIPVQLECKTKTGGWTTAQDNGEGLGMGRPLDNGNHVPRALQGINLAMSHKFFFRRSGRKDKRVGKMFYHTSPLLDVIRQHITWDWW
mmetsp:Transcript_16585/g.21986  ORF Transcript_16585/g.21986 Transcript_16585/m.21986 type:complete len:95 (+) Transcript_16585:682-966(+)